MSGRGRAIGASELGRELWETARLAAPIAVAQAGWALMGVVDAAVVGRAGAVPLASVGLANAVFTTVFCVGMGTLLGVDPLISQAFGAGDPARARRLLWMGNWLALGISAALAVPLALTPLLLRPAGISAEVADGASSYIWWRLPGLVPALWFLSARCYFQAAKLTRWLVVAALSANVLNALADILLVFGGAGLPAWLHLGWVPAMGAGGAAIATSLCSGFQLLVVAIPLRRHRVPGSEGAWRGSPGDVRTALRVGAPVGLHMLAEVAVFALAAVLAARLGASQAAAHQLCIAFSSFSFTVAVGVGSAGSVRVGWAVGAGDGRRARLAGFTAFLAGTAFMSCSAAAFLLFPRALASAMTSDASVLAVAAPLLMVVAAFQVSDGLQGVGAGVLRGAGDSRFTFIANLAGHYLVGLPIALWLGVRRGLGVVGLWWGLATGLTAVAASLVARFAWLSSRPIRPLAQAPESGDPAAELAAAAEPAK